MCVFLNVIYCLTKYENEEYDLLFEPHEKNKCDFRYILRSRPDGEKLIKMVVENKTLYIAIDLITEIA